MNQKLSQLFQELEMQRLQLTEDVRKYPDTFNIKPDQTKWSVHEILAHLISAEKLSLQYLKKKKLGIDKTGNTGVFEELKMGALKISQRLPFRFKAPQPVVAATASYSNMDDLVDDWNVTRENFKMLLEEIRDDQLKKKIYKHFFVGRLNVTHAIIFLKEHVNHHLPQINRLLKYNSFITG